MDILEELKRLSPQANSQTESNNNVLFDLADYQRSNISDTMMQVYSYLRELVLGLNQLQQEITTDFKIQELGTIKNLRQTDYTLSFENNTNTDTITLSFNLTLEDKITFETKPSFDGSILEEMDRARIEFNYFPEMNQVEIDRKIPVKLVFSSRPDEQYIQLGIHNYDKPGRQRFALTAQLLDDHFKNQVGYFILRRENSLISQLQEFLKVSTDSIPQLDGDITETDRHTQEMDVSRLKSLFSKEARLYLTYQNTIKEVSTKNNKFILGRSRQCDMNITSDLASRQHAHIVYRKGKFVFMDKSTNGSFVKPQGGKEVYLQGEELPLSGSGFVSLGKSVTVDNEHVIYYSVQ